MFLCVGGLKKSRKGVWILASRLIFPNFWLQRDVLAAVDPKNVALLLFAQRFCVSEA